MLDDLCLFVENLHLRVFKSKLQINTDWLLIKETRFFFVYLFMCVLNQMPDYNYNMWLVFQLVFQMDAKISMFSTELQIEISICVFSVD